jgi:UDP-glucose 4-epimerase
MGSEYYLAAYARLYGMETLSLRYSNVYGPRQNPHGEAGVVAMFGLRLRSGQGLTVYGDGSQTRDYVFVGDVAQANLAASRAPAPPAESIDAMAFNVGTGVETSVNQLAALMISAAGRQVPITRVPARVGELARNALDCGKAAREWGWRPGVSLGDGLRQTYDWIREVAA